jgi:CheY-like chemotaxis protein
MGSLEKRPAEMKTMSRNQKSIFSIQGAVCVIDEDRKTRNDLYRVLVTLGVKVITFSTAEEFLDRLDGGEPALLIANLTLPGMSGFHLMENLRHRGRQIPIIGLTGEADPDKRRKASGLGFLELIEKPFVWWSVVERVKRALCLPWEPAPFRAEFARDPIPIDQTWSLKRWMSGRLKRWRRRWMERSSGYDRWFAAGQPQVQKD